MVCLGQIIQAEIISTSQPEMGLQRYWAVTQSFSASAIVQ